MFLLINISERFACGWLLLQSLNTCAENWSAGDSWARAPMSRAPSWPAFPSRAAAGVVARPPRAGPRRTPRAWRRGPWSQWSGLRSSWTVLLEPCWSEIERAGVSVNVTSRHRLWRILTVLVYGTCWSWVSTVNSRRFPALPRRLPFLVLKFLVNRTVGRNLSVTLNATICFLIDT